jgi:hypothetical protein
MPQELFDRVKELSVIQHRSFSNTLVRITEEWMGAWYPSQEEPGDGK